MNNNNIKITYCLCPKNWQNAYISITSVLKNTKHHVGLYLTHNDWLSEDVKKYFKNLDNLYNNVTIKYAYIGDKIKTRGVLYDSLFS